MLKGALSEVAAVLLRKSAAPKRSSLVSSGKAWVYRSRRAGRLRKGYCAWGGPVGFSFAGAFSLEDRVVRAGGPCICPGKVPGRVEDGCWPVVRPCGVGDGCTLGCPPVC